MMEGVVRPPSAFSITLTLPFSRMETQELVVPRSIPMILPISHSPKFEFAELRHAVSAALNRLTHQMGVSVEISSLLIDRRLRLSRRLADHDHRRTQQASVEQVALLEYLEHAARFGVDAF